MKRLKLFLLTLSIAILTACAAFGIDAPQTINQRAAAAQITVTAVRSSALALLNAGKINVDEAKSVQVSTDAGNAAIDQVLLLKDADPASASQRLASAIAILTGVQSYLALKGAKP